MKIRITKQTAGAGGVIRPGTVIDVSESEASLLLKSGYAENLEPPTEKPTSKKKRAKES